MTIEVDTPDTSSSSPSVIKVAVIEDHSEYREYLAALLNGTDGFRCTESFRSMEEAFVFDADRV
jgi:hypothetical protein